MRGKIFYLTRSYYPFQKSGGTIIRKRAVELLRNHGFKVIVVTPNYNSNTMSYENDILCYPLNYNTRLAQRMQRVGLYEDYLDKWVKNVFKYLKNEVTENDIVFATTGGELGNIKLASMLKRATNCKYVVNFHDPILYTVVNGKKLNNNFHFSRDKYEEKYLNNTDLIITSSNTLKESLISKYPYLKSNIINNYFGYVEQISNLSINQKESKILRIAYAGNFGYYQSPELLGDLITKNDDVEIFYIGDFKNYMPINKYKKIKGINFIEWLPHEQFVDFMLNNVDVGFVSLTNSYFGACVPSKIYEYINLGIPILGALPDGDGKDIINKFSYGIACNYNDIQGLSEALLRLSNKEELERYRKKIMEDREKWAMDTKIIEVIKELNQFH